MRVHGSLSKEDVDLVWKDMEVRKIVWKRTFATVTTLYPCEMRNKHVSKCKLRPSVFVAVASSDGCQWYDKNVHLVTFLDAGSRALVASGSCGNEALPAELLGSFQQVYGISLPTNELKLHMFTMSNQTVFDAS